MSLLTQGILRHNHGELLAHLVSQVHVEPKKNKKLDLLDKNKCLVMLSLITYKTIVFK